MFKYSEDNGQTWKEVLIPEGAYEIKALISESIAIEPNTNTLKSVITLKNNYKVSFKEKITVASLLGFDHKECRPGTHKSEKIINILSVNR